METLVLTLNFDKICRVCLLESDSMFSIYSELLEQNSDEKIPTICEILVNILNVHIQDDEMLPSMICVQCIESAHSAYKFQQQCNKSQSLLELYLEQIKYNSENNSTEQINSNSSGENDLALDDGLLNESLDYVTDQYLINEEKIDTDVNDDDDDDYDDLKNCLPLGEETVDQLIQENFSVENLEMISPKMDFDLNFNLNLKPESEDNHGNHKITSINDKTTKDDPSMNYYKNNKRNGSVTFDCNICKKAFKFDSFLRTHLKSHNEDKPYMCTECKKSFKVYGTLIHHSRSHSGEQPFECKECGKKYKQAGTLTAHMRIHTGSKPYLCTICGRGFRQAPDLTYHMRTHTKEKPYMCNVCGKTMSMQCHLVQHMRSHTGEKPFKCSVCDKAFPSSTRLKRHSIVHTTLKPYTCPTCDKSFNRSSSLKVHTKIHTGIKSHSCNICYKSFLWAHSLRAHIQTHLKTSKDSEDVNDAAKSNSVKLGTFAVYSNGETSANESFELLSNGDGDSGNGSFQICSLTAGDESLETFTLYTTETDPENLQLSVVDL